MQTKVFVVVPAYNVQAYIERCIQSIFSNRALVWVICIDDGSNDQTPAILESLKPLHTYLTVLHVENGGPSRARNIGIEFALNHAATGDYLIFADSDDFMEPGYVDTMLAETCNGKADVVCSSFQFYRDGRSHPFLGMDSVFGSYNAFEGTRLLLSDKTIQSHPHCKLFKAHLWESVRFPAGINYMEDQATVFKAFCLATNITLISNYGYFYNQRENSLCSSPFSNRKVLDGLEGYLEGCLYPFAQFTEQQARLLRNVAIQSLCSAYLTLIPYYDPKNASLDETMRLKSVEAFISSRRIVWTYKPLNRRDCLKKWCYLLLRPFYRRFYRIAKRR